MNSRIFSFFAAATFFFMSSLKGDVSSHIQGSSRVSKEELSSPTKCPSGGCYEGEEVEVDYPLLVFMSFSTPEATLLSFAKELEVYGGAFVIRGLPDNSFAVFFNKLTRLKDLGMNAPILIDPDSFEDYQITEVPTIVLKGEKAFDKIIGNIPISNALEIFAEKGEERILAREFQCIPSHASKQCNKSIQSKHEIHNSRRSQ